MICAFTGHRPEKLPWGTQENDPLCRALQAKLQWAIADLEESGYNTFLCGMARGCDLLFFDAAHALRASFPQLRLIAVLPCAGQARLWPTPEQSRHAAALAEADEVRVLSDHYYPGCMHARNQYMVDHADCLLSVWDGSSGGTASTVAYARRRGIPIRSIWR